MLNKNNLVKLIDKNIYLLKEILFYYYFGLKYLIDFFCI